RGPGRRERRSAPRERHGQTNAGAALWRGPELELAANELRTLAHPAHPESALEPVAARPETLSAWKPSPVVGHGRLEHAVALRDADDGFARFGVAADIRERLLHDAVDRALELGVEAALGSERIAV